MTQTSVSPGCARSRGSMAASRTSRGATAAPFTATGSRSSMPHAFSVSTPSKCPGQRTVFSAKSFSVGLVKMKLGMPGVTAHSSHSSLPNCVKRKRSRSVSACTSTMRPFFRTLTSIMRRIEIPRA